MKSENNNNIFDDNNIVNKLQRNVTIPFLTYEDNNLDLNSSKKDEKKNAKIPIFDLNQIFQFKFSYNFDVLKNLLETMIQNQRESQKVFLKMEKDNELKINELENNIIDLKIKLNNSNPQLLEELKKEKESIQKETEKIQKKIIIEKNLEKEEKENITHLTVSKK